MEISGVAAVMILQVIQLQLHNLLMLEMENITAVISFIKSHSSIVSVYKVTMVNVLAKVGDTCIRSGSLNS